MPCEICNEFHGVDRLRKKSERPKNINRKILKKDIMWDSFKASAKSCYICEILIKGCRGCLQQHEIDESDIINFEVRFYYQNYEGELADVDKTISFLLKDGSFFDVQVFKATEEEVSIPRSWESIPYANRTTPRTDSPAALNTIKSWLERCHEDDHEDCIIAEKTPLPKRVIDVSGDGDVRLVETHGKCARYICLSHCWGLLPIITTSTATLEKRKKKIAPSDLSKTFKDAIFMTRKLGVRYIWIDSLCIVQDSLADWQIESAKMSSIYTYAYVTLAGTQASNGQGGLFKETPDYEVSGTTPQGEKYQLFFRDRIDHHLDLQGVPNRNDPEPHVIGHSTVSHHPLLTRAWVYQERLLSPRVLHFGPYELFLECRMMTMCECGDISFHGSSEVAPAAMIKLLFAEAIYSITEDHDWGTYAAYYLARVWRTLLCSYTSLYITKDSDRLPAIGGLARSLAEVRQVEYVAGLWENTLNDDLLWYVFLPETSRKPRPQPASAPTWSWASVATWVLYWDHMYYYDPNEDVTGDERPPYENFSKVENWDVDPAGVDEFGEMRQGTLEIKGLIGEGVLESDVQNDGNTLHYVKFSQTRLRFYADYLLGHEGEDQVLPGTRLTCIRMSLLREGNTDYLISLVLRLVDRAPEAYQRVGLMAVPFRPPGDPYGDVFNEEIERVMTIR